MDELIDAFSIKNLNKSDSIVDVNRLEWFNRQHFKMIDLPKLAEQVYKRVNESAGLDPISLEYAMDIASVMRDRISSIKELFSTHQYLFSAPPAPICAQSSSDFIPLHEALCSLACFDMHSVKAILDQYKWGEKRQDMQNLRTVLTGKPTGAPLSEIITLLGRKRVLQRLSRYLTAEKA
jgi:glutamyl/glutaminyl-tRNA synthetase